MKSKVSINRAVQIIAGLCVMVCVFATPVLAEFQRTKIAVLDFVMIGEKMEPEGIGAILSEWFITSIVQSGRYDVVERAMLQKIIAEQNLSTTGLVDESTASQLGKLLGVDVIITGSILKVRNTMDINARIISVQSGSIIAAESISSNSDKDYHELVKQLTAKIMQNFPLTGYIVKKDKKTATIDLGSMAGLVSGTDFVVYKEGEVIKHPKTGEVLDVEQIITGRIRITKVSKKVATGDILHEEKEGIEYGHLVKSVQQNSDKSVSQSQHKISAVQQASAPATQTATPPARILKGQTKKALAAERPPANAQEAKPASTPAPALITQSATPPQSPREPKTNGTAAEPAPAVEKTTAHGQSSGEDTRPAANQPAMQAPPRNHVAVFPSAFHMEADVIAGLLNGRVPDVVEEVLEGIDRRRQFQLTNLLKDEGLRGLAWNKYNPNMDGIVDQARQRGVDFVVLYFFSFWEGQGLVNGWGTDFQNPDFKVFLIDVQNRKVLQEEDSSTIALDQLFLELKGMTRKLFLKADFPD
ncbi:MAG: hypothetical protein VR65_01585 [Desulfobulbaceae bacterium BRH_c16a]|nr:MAG: hypothetical protein VR65_01585 [Desulfobulbaceae bacterium BRH_c16a]